MRNAISVVFSDLERQKERVRLPGFGEERDFFLIGIISKTNTYEDFKVTFAGKLTVTDVLAAKALFGEKDEVNNNYGVFVDDHFQMIYFFNLLFGEYNREKRIIVYKTPREILLKTPLLKEITEKKDPLMFNSK